MAIPLDGSDHFYMTGYRLLVLKGNHHTPSLWLQAYHKELCWGQCWSTLRCDAGLGTVVAYMYVLPSTEVPTVAYHRYPVNVWILKCDMGPRHNLYCIVHNLVDIPVSDHLTQAPTSRRVGSFKFHAPYTRTLEYQYVFFFDSVDMWNNLPSDVVEAASLGLFKDQLAKLHVLKTAPNSYI